MKSICESLKKDLEDGQVSKVSLEENLVEITEILRTEVANYEVERETLNRELDQVRAESVEAAVNAENAIAIEIKKVLELEESSKKASAAFASQFTSAIGQLCEVFTVEENRLHEV